MALITTEFRIASTLSPASAARPGRKALWTGRICAGLAVAFLLFDAILKIARVPEAMENTAQLGWPVSALFGLGVLQLILAALYLVPRTAALGALLWCGYLGGAVATHVRLGNPWFSHILFPVYVAVLLWLGLWFRDARVRALFPFSSR
jgi:hypothetical protein